jgi:hypothetical protein
LPDPVSECSDIRGGEEAALPLDQIVDFFFKIIRGRPTDIYQLYLEEIETKTTMNMSQKAPP